MLRNGSQGRIDEGVWSEEDPSKADIPKPAVDTDFENFSRASGEIPVATGFSRWMKITSNTSAVGTMDVCRAYGTHSNVRNHFHRLKPVATGMSPLCG